MEATLIEESTEIVNPETTTRMNYFDLEGIEEWCAHTFLFLNKFITKH